VPRGVVLATLMLLGMLLAELWITGWLYEHGLYFGPAEPSLVEGGIAMLLFYALIALVYVGAILALDRRPLRALGVTREGRGAVIPWFVLGLLIGAPMIVQTCVETGNWDALRYAGWVMLLGAPFFLFPAAVEEVVFRGWLMQSIAARHDGFVALWASAIVFAAWHLDLSGSPINAVLSVLFRLPAGLMLGLLALRSRGLWAPIGAHTGWNVASHGAVAITADDEGLSPWDASYMTGQNIGAEDLIDPFFVFGVAHLIAALALVFWLARAEYKQLLADSAAWRWLKSRASGVAR
jgi:membrane protease YdiL (CAAX protease family)